MQLINFFALLYFMMQQALIQAKIPRPEDFYGSEALLDGYCDEAQYFIDTFTISSEQRLSLEGSADDVMYQLATVKTTGQ